MATAGTTSTHELIEQRLDALDRALLGLLPRSERLAIVADVEAKILGVHAANPTRIVEASAADDPVAEVVAPTPRRPAGRRRSRMALASGIVGIVALVLLLVSPLTYLFVVASAELLGELFAYALLGMNGLGIAIGGAAAVVLGITALVRLSRQGGRQAGHGWAITGLCTGPMPMLIGGLGMLTIGLPMVFELAQSRSQCVPASYVDGTSIPPATALPPALPVSAPVTWTNAAPAGCAPGAACGPVAVEVSNAGVYPVSSSAFPVSLPPISANVPAPSPEPSPQDPLPLENAAPTLSKPAPELPDQNPTY
jgi:hypothetical protein